MQSKLISCGVKVRAIVVCVLATCASIGATAQSFDHSHRAWSDILKSIAKVEGPKTTVNYAQLKTDSKALGSYLASISAVSDSEFKAMNEAQRLAFLINAYNAFTVQLIVENYPVKSIKDIGGVFSSPWKKKFFKLFGKDTSLDNIEHDMIRKDFKEPRIHFAVVCASIGCPALMGQAFTADKLEEMLENGAKLFLSDSSRNRINAAEKKLELSSIFKWYGDDFRKNGATLEDFVAQRITTDPEVRAQIKDKVLKISFLPYDWNLNEHK